MDQNIPKTPPPVDSIDALLVRNSTDYAAKDAIVAIDPDTNQTEHISFAKLNNLSRRTAQLLLNRGIRRGDRIAILMHNAPEVIISELAAGLIGATTVPLDFKRDTLERKIFKLQDTRSVLLMSKNEYDEQAADNKKLLAACPSLKLMSWRSLPQFETMLPDDSVSPDKISRLLENYYVILYTSGTTALPKGTLLSTRACLANAMGIVAWQKFTSSDRFNIVLPLHHINSTQFCLAMLFVGGTIILNNRYSASTFWDVVSRYQATNTSIVPTILHDLLVRKEEFAQKKLDIGSLKRLCIGSAPVLPEETLRFYKAFGVRVVQGYGQTETALRVAGVPVDTDEKTYQNLVRSNTIGMALTNNRLAIMDAANREKKEGEHGEICISGPVLADGYLNNKEETQKAFVHGWFHSGDLGYWKKIDGKKFFFIIGRLKEIIIKGGVNISPSAIEDALLSAFPAIAEVSVVGYPDVRMGEEIAAVIVPKSKSTKPEDILGAFAKGQVRGLSNYEYPKKIFIVESLPKTSTGKIQRVEVKKMVRQKTEKEQEKHFYVRRIKPTETDILRAAVKINNDRWTGLPATLSQFRSRATNGILWGAFEESAGLVGSLSCVRLSLQEIQKLRTWDEATAEGTLSNDDPHGDTILCVAISVASRSRARSADKKQRSPAVESAMRQAAQKMIHDYVTSGKDHVLQFHTQPKAGIRGATVWKILANGRPEDRESMGYNVLMKYPALSETTKIVRSRSASPSFLLIEHALLFAKKMGLGNVIAFSRPSGFRQYLLEKVQKKN